MCSNCSSMISGRLFPDRSYKHDALKIDPRGSVFPSQSRKDYHYEAN